MPAGEGGREQAPTVRKLGRQRTMPDVDHDDDAFLVVVREVRAVLPHARADDRSALRLIDCHRCNVVLLEVGPAQERAGHHRLSGARGAEPGDEDAHDLARLLLSDG
jgi:hypothetical protein